MAEIFEVCKDLKLYRLLNQGLPLLKERIWKMSYILSYVLLIVGFVLLVKGADFFVDGASSVAAKLKVPSVIIGLTVVAFGTSAPEAAVGITASLGGSNELAVGNVVGSNIFNLLTVVGFCALIKPFAVEKQIMKSEYPLSILAAFALIVMLMDIPLDKASVTTVSRCDGIILLCFFVIFMTMTVRSALGGRGENAEEDPVADMSVIRSIFSLVLGLAGIIAGGQLVVNSSKEIALSFGLSETLIGLTIVAIGTSLPELVTSIVAARKGMSGLAIGNVVGSNLFNIFFILGISATISPMTVEFKSVYDAAVLIAASLIVYLMSLKKSKEYTRIDGLIMILMYVAYSAYIIIRN